MEGRVGFGGETSFLRVVSWGGVRFSGGIGALAVGTIIFCALAGWTFVGSLGERPPSRIKALNFWFFSRLGATLLWSV